MARALIHIGFRRMVGSFPPAPTCLENSKRATVLRRDLTPCRAASTIPNARRKCTTSQTGSIASSCEIFPAASKSITISVTSPANYPWDKRWMNNRLGLATVSCGRGPSGRQVEDKYLFDPNLWIDADGNAVIRVRSASGEEIIALDRTRRLWAPLSKQ